VDHVESLEDRYLRIYGEVLTFGSGDCGQLAHGIENDEDLMVKYPRVVHSLRFVIRRHLPVLCSHCQRTATNCNLPPCCRLLNTEARTSRASRVAASTTPPTRTPVRCSPGDAPTTAPSAGAYLHIAVIIFCCCMHWEWKNKINAKPSAFTNPLFFFLHRPGEESVPLLVEVSICCRPVTATCLC